MKLTKAHLLKPVRVTWLDHVGHGASWVNLADLHPISEPAEFITYGFLLKYSRDIIVLGSTLDKEKTTSGDVTVLLRSCVKEIHFIEEE